MNEIEILVKRYPELLVAKDDILKAYKVLRDCYGCGGKLLIAGNGGSAADAEHIVGELMKGFKLPRKPDADFADKLVKENKELGTCARTLSDRRQCACRAARSDRYSPRRIKTASG